MKIGAASFYRYFPVSQRDRNWGLYATTAGEARVPSHTEYPPGGHPKGFAFDCRHGRILEGFALLYISSGSGKFESKPGGFLVSASIEAGQAFLLFPGVWHRYAPRAETGWYEHWIGFDGDIARRWLRHRFLSRRNPVVKINAEDTVLATFSRVVQSIRANRPALQQILAGATDTLVGLIYSAQQTQPAADARTANAVDLAIARIQTDFGRALDMRLMARELGVSYSWFRKTFTSYTGLSPHRYLLELRLAHARSLLAGTRLPVKEIAAETGFEDEYYFSRLFRQRLELSPSEWRNRSHNLKAK